MGNYSKIHSLRLEEILADPSILRFEGVLWGATEVTRYSPSGLLIAEIDILLFTGNRYTHQYQVIEYKMSKKRIEKAKEQLYRGRSFVRHHLHSDATMWFAHGTYQKTKIK